MSDSEELYYLWDSRKAGVTGNCMMFWKKGNSGYTYKLDNVAVFTKEKAFAQHESRGTDVPMLKSLIDSLSHPHVDIQDYWKVEEDKKN